MLGGVRYYFGDPNKSLIDRHRQDDPEPDLTGDLSVSGPSGPSVTCVPPYELIDGVCVNRR